MQKEEMDREGYEELSFLSLLHL